MCLIILHAGLSCRMKYAEQFLCCSNLVRIRRTHRNVVALEIIIISKLRFSNSREVPRAFWVVWNEFFLISQVDGVSDDTHYWWLPRAPSLGRCTRPQWLTALPLLTSELPQSPPLRPSSWQEVGTGSSPAPGRTAWARWHCRSKLNSSWHSPLLGFSCSVQLPSLPAVAAQEAPSQALHVGHVTWATSDRRWERCGLPQRWSAFCPSGCIFPL